jgi:hypothetical protein
MGFNWTFKEMNNEPFILYTLIGVTAVVQWLKYCATNQKVAGSITEAVMVIFTDINPSVRIMALESTQPLTEMSAGSISWGVNAAGA